MESVLGGKKWALCHVRQNSSSLGALRSSSCPCATGQVPWCQTSLALALPSWSPNSSLGHPLKCISVLGFFLRLVFSRYRSSKFFNWCFKVVFFFFLTACVGTWLPGKVRKARICLCWLSLCKAADSYQDRALKTLMEKVFSVFWIPEQGYQNWISHWSLLWGQIAGGISIMSVLHMKIFNWDHKKHFLLKSHIIYILYTSIRNWEIIYKKNEDF